MHKMKDKYIDNTAERHPSGLGLQSFLIAKQTLLMLFFVIILYICVIYAY